MGDISESGLLPSCFLRSLICAFKTSANGGLSLLSSRPAIITRVDTLRYTINGCYGCDELDGYLQGLLEVCETEHVSIVHHLVDKVVREGDILVGFELVLPVPDVELALHVVRIIKYAEDIIVSVPSNIPTSSHLQFAIETAGAITQSRIDQLQMVGRPNDE